MRRGAGSVPFLLTHELRLAWRAVFPRRAGGRTRRFAIPPIVLLPLILAVAAALLGIPVGRALANVDIVLNPLVVLIADAAVALVFTLMLSQTLVSAVQVFYERGDLDLLLSSPVSPTRVLTVRTLAMAVSPALVVWALLTPIVLPVAVLGHPELLATYLMAAALAVLASSVGIALALALFTAIGPRRTRAVAQVLAAVIGALFVIVANIPSLVGNRDAEDAWARLAREAATGEIEIADIFYWPARALAGDPLPLFLFCIAAGAVFAVVATLVGRRFADNAAAAQGSAMAARRRPGRREVRFGGGAFRAVLSKEMRLLRRDPGLISQLLLRIFYLVPLTFAIIQGSDSATGFSLATAAGAVALLAGQLAGSIAWITISAEDSPQLLAASPMPIRFFWRAKLAATLLPPGLLVLPAVIGIALFSPPAGLVAAVGAAGSGASAALVNLWLQKPARRREFRRQWHTNFAASILELLMSLSWAAAAGLAVYGSLWALAPAGLALVVLALSRRSEAAMLERLSTA